MWCVEKTDSLPSRISDRSYSVSGPKSFAGSWCVAVLLLGPLASAADELPSTGETKIDEWHDLLADSVVGSSEWLDSFFLDDNYSSEANTTRATISVSSFTEQGEGTDTRARFRLRLRLPRLENRAMLYISGSTSTKPVRAAMMRAFRYPCAAFSVTMSVSIPVSAVASDSGAAKSSAT